MSATGERRDGPAGASPSELTAADPEGAYFRAIEDAFVRLRGAPLLLSPADYQVAARWHRAGVPLGLVVMTLDEVFAKRRERGAKGRINSLRYCGPAVEAAWAEVQELQGPPRRSSGPESPVGERLAELAAALPAELPGGGAWAERVRRLDGSTEALDLAQRLRVPLRPVTPAVRAAMAAAALPTPDRVIGETAAEPYWTVTRLLQCLDELTKGVTELCCHPGRFDEMLLVSRYNRQREAELQALTDPTVQQRLRERGIALLTYADLAC